MSARFSAAQRAAIDRGWSAADVAEHELVDDAWIAANTVPGKSPSTVRHLASRAASVLRTLKAGGFTRDQMRRIAARTGYPYIEAWSTQNQGAMSGVWGALIHHTGTSWSAAGDYPTLRIVQQGRSDLQNSLCMFGLGKSGTAYLVSEKLSWHAGAGNVNGLTDGNGYLAGIEAESDGVNWTAQQRDAYPRLVASILIECGQTDPRPNVGDKYTTRHASFALPVGRKTDASGLDMDLFWKQVYGYLANPASINKNYGKTPTPAPAPARPVPAPKPPLARPPRLAWTLPAGHWLGNVTGGATQHSGDPRYDSAQVRALVRNVQQWLIYRGVALNHFSTTWATSTWADGIWGAETDTAMALWHARFYPGQKAPSQCWKDDYSRLTA